MDAFWTSINSMISLRKAHLGEVPSTASSPIDESQIPVEVRRLIVSPIYGFAEKNRRFLGKLIACAPGTMVDVPSAPPILQNIKDALVRLIELSSDFKRYLPLQIGSVEGNHYLPILTGGHTSFDSVAEAVNIISNNGGTSTFDTVVLELLAVGSGKSKIQARSTDFASYYNLEVGTPGQTVSNVSQALGRLIADLNLFLDAGYDAGNTDPVTATQVAIPGLVTDIGGAWYQVYSWMKDKVNSYAEDTQLFISDDDYAVLAAMYET
jgi:hypothetical protein